MSSASSPPPELALKKPQLIQDGGDDDECQVLGHRRPTLSKVADEVMALGRLSVPTAVTGLVLYSRAMISMLFLGRLGGLALAGGSLALGFANITGYSVLAGLALGMEPVCGQAFGARRRGLLAVALHRTVLLLLVASVPISLLWMQARKILLLLDQDPDVAAAAQTFAAAAVPDLAVLAFLHPLRIYLRSQNLTLPITCCSLLSVALHLPITHLFTVKLQLGIAGVAFSVAVADLNLLLFLVVFLLIRGNDAWESPSIECLRGWLTLLRLAVPTAAAVCLEWWWYELMIVFSGLLINPRATVASMGILIQVTSLIYVFPSSLGLGASTRVAHELGAGRPRGARRAAIVALSVGFVVGAAAATFGTLVRHCWARMFTEDPDVIRLTAAALPIVGLCELGNCPQTAGCGVLRGSARPAAGANINLGAFYLVGMPVALLLGFGLKIGFVGLWFGLLAAQASCAACMTYAVATTNWDAQVERAKELTKATAAGDGAADAPCTPTKASSAGGAKYVPIYTENDEQQNIIIAHQKLDNLEKGLNPLLNNNP